MAKRERQGNPCVVVVVVVDVEVERNRCNGCNGWDGWDGFGGMALMMMEGEHDGGHFVSDNSMRCVARQISGLNCHSTKIPTPHDIEMQCHTNEVHTSVY